MAERDPIETLTGERRRNRSRPTLKKPRLRKPPSPRRKVMLGLAGAMLLAGGGWYALHDGSHVSTDNAYVECGLGAGDPARLRRGGRSAGREHAVCAEAARCSCGSTTATPSLAFDKAEAAYLMARRQFGQSAGNQRLARRRGQRPRRRHRPGPVPSSPPRNPRSRRPRSISQRSRRWRSPAQSRATS